MSLPDGFSEFFLDGAREALLEGALDEALDKTGVVNNSQGREKVENQGLNSSQGWEKWKT